MSQIKNKRYREFLDKGTITPFKLDDLKLVLDNLKSRHKLEARALLICLYYSGARPNEVLRLKGKDITKDGNYLVIHLKGSKRGLPRPFHLTFKRKYVKELYNYAQGTMPEKLLFFNFIGKYVRNRVKKDGTVSERLEISNRLRYHFNKWFSVLPEGTINPYFLRHNRFSQMIMEGSSLQHAKFLKGSRSVDSLNYYIHMSPAEAKKAARYIK